MRYWLESLRALRRYPSALAGLALIALLLAVSLYTVVAIPYASALEQWRGGEQWRFHPVNASPAWLDRLQGGNRARTIHLRGGETVIEHRFAGGHQQRTRLSFDYPYDGFPSEINLFLAASGHAGEPFVNLTWQRPDGREIALGNHRVGGSTRIALSQDWALERRLDQPAHVGLLQADGDGPPQPLHGRYTLRIDAVLFGEGAGLEADLVLYGRVHGLAGSDHQRRDLLLALLWGTPVALAFGLLAAAGTTVTTLIIAATGVWYGGWVDATIQRLTEVNLILPLLPILVMIGTLYSTSIWLMLGVVIALGIFSASIKMYRAMLLPLREAPWVEAARAYGASDARIILRYLVPRLLPVLIPTLVTLIPAFVFLEASLAVLGLGDPLLPTWGKVLNDAREQSALYDGHYYWIVGPAALLLLTGLGFALLGFALDRIFNPRLRGR